MKSLSLDLRERISAALDAGSTQPAIAERFAVSLSSVERIAARKRRGQDLAPGVSPGRPARISPDEHARFEALVRSSPTWTLETLRVAWETQAGTTLSIPTVARTLEKLRFVYKKKPGRPGARSRPARHVSGSDPGGQSGGPGVSG